MFKVSASQAAKEILFLAAQSLGPEAPLPRNMILAKGGKYPEQIWIAAWLEPADLDDLESFCKNVAVPIATALRRELPHESVTEYVELELPKSIDSAGESYRGIWLRVVIDPQVPVPLGMEAWSRRARYYDVEQDRLVHGLCGICLRVDVCPRTRV